MKVFFLIVYLYVAQMSCDNKSDTNALKASNLRVNPYKTLEFRFAGQKVLNFHF